MHGVLLYEDELKVVIPADHPLREFKKVSLKQAAELPMLLLGEEFQVRQIWQAQLANLGRRGPAAFQGPGAAHPGHRRAANRAYQPGAADA
ncbi:LysR family transcriptional regulator substrate-binding protein, partial [Corynebacterium diphtheriae]